MSRNLAWLGTVFFVALGLGSCGTTLPVMDLQHPSKDEFSAFVDKIVEHVHCEVKDSFNRNYLSDPKSNRYQLKTWAAKVALTIRALDKGNFNPGVATFDKAVTFAVSATGQFESDGTRELTMTYYLPFVELIDDQPHNPDYQRPPMRCPIGDEAISGNLGINETFSAALKTWDSQGNLGDNLVKGPFDTITHHVTFVIVSGGTITPTWKLVHISANTAPPFLSAVRTSTDDLLVTIGPATLGTNKENPKLRTSIPSTALSESFQIERLKTVTLSR